MSLSIWQIALLMHYYFFRSGHCRFAFLLVVVSFCGCHRALGCFKALHEYGLLEFRQFGAGGVLSTSFAACGEKRGLFRTSAHARQCRKAGIREWQRRPFSGAAPQLDTDKWIQVVRGMVSSASGGGFLIETPARFFSNAIASVKEFLEEYLT